MKKDSSLKKAFGSADAAFIDAVEKALTEIRKNEEEPIVKKKIRISLAFAIIICLLAAAAFAATKLGVLDFILGRYDGRIQVLPSAQRIIQENVECGPAHTQFADFAVRQAVFDGKGAYVAVAVTPTDDGTLLLGTDSGPDMPVSDFGPRFENETATIADYAKEIGAKRMAYTGVGSTPSSDISFDSLDYMLEDDGTLVYMLSGVYEGNANEADIQLNCLTYDSANEDDEFDDAQRGALNFTLTASSALGEAVSAEGADFGQSGARVEEVRLKATAMAVYFQIRFTVTDEAKFARNEGGLWFDFIDEKGEEIGTGATTDGSVAALNEDGSEFMQTGSLNAMEHLPDTIALRAYNCWDKQRYETRDIALRSGN